MNKKLIILLISAAVLFLGAWFFGGSSFGSVFLWNASGQGKWLLPLIGITALVDSVNPCAFSILLLTVAFLFSIGKMRKKILAIGGFYIAGIFVIYMLIGLGILQTLHIFNTPHFMAKVGSALLVLMGAISLLNEFFPAFPLKLRIPSGTHRAIGSLMEKASFSAAFGLGALVGLCEFPCTGGPYLMALGLLHDQTTFWSGLGYLILYNAIFVLPLIVILAIASNKELFEKAQAWKKTETKNMRLWGGIIMILIGIIVYFV